jgi:translation initiation factor 3 subunit B
MAPSFDTLSEQDLHEEEEEEIDFSGKLETPTLRVCGPLLANHRDLFA